MITLKNDILSIKVNRHGAELWSIRDHSGREFIWQADPAFWKRHAPVLFPIVGSLWDKKYRVDGKEYSLEQHGFARDMDFHLVSSDENTLWYELKSDAETLAKYPYAFTLKIGYKLTGNKIQVMWEVSNNDNKTMYFQIGAHPAFYYPDFNPDTEERGAFRLYKRGENGEMKPLETLKYILISEKGCADTEHVYELETPEGKLPLTTSTFDRDALIIENQQVSKVVLESCAGEPFVSVEFDSPALGMWSPAGLNAPFVCIEPWYGRCDRKGFTGPLDEKDLVNALAPEQVFRTGYTIEVF